jgi:hypothetical protein
MPKKKGALIAERKVADFSSNQQCPRLPVIQSRKYAMF